MRSSEENLFSRGTQSNQNVSRLKGDGQVAGNPVIRETVLVLGLFNLEKRRKDEDKRDLSVSEGLRRRQRNYSE